MSLTPLYAEEPHGDTQSVLLFLPDGALHLRFHVTLEGRSLSQRREEYIDQLLKRLDTDQDGRLSSDERDRSPLFSYGRRRFDNPFLRSLQNQKFSSRADIERDVTRFGNLFSYRQDESAAENDLKVFEILDNDASGRIDQAEMRLAVARIANLDQDRDQCISFDEFADDPEPDPAEMQVMTLGNVSETPPESNVAKSMMPTDRITIAENLLRLYDRNRDRHLDGRELGWDDSRMAALDQNNDKKLNSRELRGIATTPVDLELAVDIWGSTELGEPIRVLQSAADRRIPAPRPDLVKLIFGSTTVTFSFRKHDPVQSALENARIRFNTLDIDANGYLDDAEVEDDYRFRAKLFNAMDANQDGLLYAEEMQDYVTAVCEPAATSCHVNLYDTGPGYFQMLDFSGDGRISVRELRNMEQTLASHEKVPGQGISKSDMGRHYFVEFVRGDFQVFGATDTLIAQGPSFIERDAVGPSWFQALDRNRDGDLTYLVNNPLYPPEFIYHPEDAVAMDADQDGLISYLEAEEYIRKMTSQSLPTASNTP